MKWSLLASTCRLFRCRRRRRRIVPCLLGVIVIAIVVSLRYQELGVLSSFLIDVQLFDSNNNYTIGHYSHREVIAGHDVVLDFNITDSSNNSSNNSSKLLPVDYISTTPTAVFVFPIVADTGSPNTMYEEGSVVSKFLQFIPVHNNNNNASFLLSLSSSNLSFSKQHQQPFVWILQATTGKTHHPICYPELVEQLVSWLQLMRRHNDAADANVVSNNTTTNDNHTLPPHQAPQSPQAQQQLFHNSNGDGNIPQHNTVHIFNWFDGRYFVPRCINMEQLFGKHNVVYWKRSIVVGRSYQPTTQSMKLGAMTRRVRGRNVRYISYVVRTDVLEELHRRAMELYQQQQLQPLPDTRISRSRILPHDRSWNFSNPRDMTDYLVTLDRPGDVIHHWPAAVVGNYMNGTNDNNIPADTATRVVRGVSYSSSQWRTLTSRTLLQLTAASKTKYQEQKEKEDEENTHQQRPQSSSSSSLRIVCDFQGVAGRVGREGKSRSLLPFVNSMLQFKIIVVVQRDEWEGHFRLFEALISGAMVLHDRFLAMPFGIQENVNIVMFDNMTDLTHKVFYYLSHTQERLEIARQGRRLAMCHHRSWHRMEQVIFGHTKTACDE